jgi:hypothetical protein
MRRLPVEILGEYLRDKVPKTPLRRAFPRSGAALCWRMAAGLAEAR